MAQNKPRGNQLARLLQALEAKDELTHAQAQELLPELVEAQLAGEDVAANPNFAAVERHLQRCAECLAVYEQLAEELDVQLNDTAPLPQPGTAPQFFQTLRKTRTATLWLIRGELQIDLKMPRWSAGHLSAGSGLEDILLHQRVPELPGTPLITVKVKRESQNSNTIALVVSIRQQGAARWQVQITHGDDVRSATTDTQGHITFSGLTMANLDTLTLHAKVV